MLPASPEAFVKRFFPPFVDFLPAIDIVRAEVERLRM